MVAYTKFQSWAEVMVEGANLGSDAFKVMLTNSAPNAATHTVKADITDIAAGAGYTAGGNALTTSSSAQSGGTYKLVFADSVFTASGGSIGPFRYAVIYDDTMSSPAKPLVGFYDYGSSVTLADTQTFTVDFDATTGVLQVA